MPEFPSNKPIRFSALALTAALFLTHYPVFAQNSLIGDGFGGRLWYVPCNYSVGSYSGYAVCGDACGKNAGQLYAWGTNQYGQLGIGTQTGIILPAAVPGMSSVKYFTAGYCMAAITSDNSGWAWGGPFQQTPISLVPIKVVTNAKYADCGTYMEAFVLNDGTVWSLGSNIFGGFGNGSIDPTTTTVASQMIGVTNAVRVAVGAAGTAVLMADGTVWAAGWNVYGALGNNSPSSAYGLSPVQVSGLNHIVDIKANADTYIALDSAGNVYSWGWNGWGGIGNGPPWGSTVSEFVPVKITGLSNIVAISGCDDGIHFLALDSARNCWGWGFNAYGQLGTGNFNEVLTPYLVQTNVVDIMAGETFSYIMKSDGTLWCAGGSNGVYTGLPGSIWLNLPDGERRTFTQLDPTAPPINLCQPVRPMIVNAAAQGCGAIRVDARGGALPYSYDIGTVPQDSPNFTGLTTGNYTVTVTDLKGCTSSVPVTVTTTNTIKNMDLDVVNPTCTLPNGSIDFASIHGGYAPFTYSVDSSAFTTLQQYANLDSGTYLLRITDAAGCTYDSTVLLSNLGQPPTEAVAGPDQIISALTTVIQANTPSSGTGHWSLVSGAGIIQSPDSPNTVISGLKPGKNVFQWTITTVCGTSESIMSVIVKYGNDAFYIPNAFTPNNDGHNDLFRVIASYNCVLDRFQVYNRLGQLIYSYTSSSSGWDGTFNGQPQPAGTYVWLLIGSDAHGNPVNWKGTVELIR